MAGASVRIERVALPVGALVWEDAAGTVRLGRPQTVDKRDGRRLLPALGADGGVLSSDGRWYYYTDDDEGGRLARTQVRGPRRTEVLDEAFDGAPLTVVDDQLSWWQADEGVVYRAPLDEGVLGPATPLFKPSSAPIASAGTTVRWLDETAASLVGRDVAAIAE